MKTFQLNNGMTVLLSDKDFVRVITYPYRWHWTPKRKGHKLGYVSAQCPSKKSRKSRIKLHRFVLRCLPSEDIDHRNRNTLDNRRKNLRICTKSQNNANQGLRDKNTSGFKGVTWHKLTRKWRAQSRRFKKTIYLGLFRSKINAAMAYDEYMLATFGRFALTNRKLGLL